MSTDKLITYRDMNGGCSCPSCGHKLDAATATSANMQAPEPGDLSLCIECAAFLRYTRLMTLEILPEEDLLEMPTDECLDLYAIRARILAIPRCKNT